MPGARLEKLTAQECWNRLGHHGIGRIALPGGEGTLVLPVNYVVEGGGIVYSTARSGAAAADPGQDITFEADHTGEHRADGWSVLAFGSAEHVTGERAVRRYARRPGAQPRAGGIRDLWIRVVPARLTGRAIRTAG
ncbi:pyridoxamine 5'-phosphate oxidase family protein [Actinacidiphila sp. ITFR-21]|uniref:pyridoxamine 5'-phosphate oxidase family protein n=1 Tax=Actinacidiphila sp. ITFR-21 TaxID=3075199 RepID=UPI00288B455F|nr:pyridoxamine 5'-phosphate oxidase family protein [Streptomyces sp. ITFR-21]WNI14728.1 pyridoxamine 5'-phosphate oxidase family protein [Streptomyces sp. ITFR-21]